MYCRSCHYDLRTLPAGCCPECAAAFDPADVATWSVHPFARGDRAFVLVQVTAAAMMLWFPLLVHVMLVAARLSLGRWPNRMGGDDPKDVAGLGALYALAVLSMLALTPVGAATTLITPCLAAATGRWRVIWKLVLIGLFGWASLGVMRWDPAQAVVWFFD